MKRCLIVDDSRVIRRVAAKILQDLGFETEEAENGRKAVDAAKVRMPDVVLLDWEMPVLDGIGCVQELRKLPQGAAATVLFCTTENGVEDIRQALAAGANEYIMKPFDGEIIRTKLLLLGVLA